MVANVFVEFFHTQEMTEISLKQVVIKLCVEFMGLLKIHIDIAENAYRLVYNALRNQQSQMI